MPQSIFVNLTGSEVQTAVINEELSPKTYIHGVFLRTLNLFLDCIIHSGGPPSVYFCVCVCVCVCAHACACGNALANVHVHGGQRRMLAIFYHSPVVLFFVFLNTGSFAEPEVHAFS